MQLQHISHILVVCAAFLIISTQGFSFFGSKKPKIGCDPNPCKNKGTCQLNAKNQSLSTCLCPEGYYGIHCESKTGCYSKPCRKGVCVDDLLNPPKFTCKCNAGFVGPKCDTADGCAKNPCKNNGKCYLNEKLKAKCKCTPGWGSKTCTARNCTIVQFKGKNIDKSSHKVFVDQSVLSRFEDLDGLAKLCKVHLHVTKSFTLQGAEPNYNIDVRDKTNPQYYIGQALQLEIFGEDGKLLCNELCLAKFPIPQSNAKCFIDGLHAIKWKWSILDPTTVHTGFAVANYKDYAALRELHQVGCKENKYL